MDTSNPVKTGEVVTFGSVRYDFYSKLKQDLGYLDKMISEGKRSNPPYVNDEIIQEDTRDDVEFLTIPINNAGKGKIAKIMCKEEANVRVSSYHITGINQKGPHVSVVRNFSSSKRLREVIDVLVKRFPSASALIQEYQYTSGSKSGFIERINLWASRGVPNTVERVKRNGWKIYDILALKMPIRVDELKDWNIGEISDQLLGVEINKTSSAGPPFYKSKSKVMSECFKIIDDFLAACNQDKAREFLEENQELLIAECKNKVDRYRTDEVEKKTRPYFSFCFSLQIFFSRLCQDFSSALEMFYNNKNCANGYGFSWSNGGSQKLLTWMKYTKEGEKKFVVYGDDVLLVTRKNGTLIANFPDFKAMDGSIHKSASDEIVNYVLKQFAKKFGANHFWQYIGKLWKQQLVGATFLVDGTQAYSSPNKGLLTGCVGTTLIDTAVSIIAYHTLIEEKVDIFNKNSVLKHMTEFGLEVKEGTWEWKEVNEDARVGEIVVEGTWLGAKMMMTNGQNEKEAIPFMPPEDLVRNIGNVRAPFKLTEMMRQRYLFDAARGYMVTGAYLFEELWNSMCELIERTPTKIICMRVQVGKEFEGVKTGEAPEHEMFAGKDFHWPSSEGWPTVRFCRNVYLSEGNKFVGSHWVEVLPDLRQEIRKYQNFYKTKMPFKVQNNWNTDFASEEKIETLRRVEDPELETVGPVPLMRRTKTPSNFPKHKPYVRSAKKEELLSNFTDDLDKTTEEFLSTQLPVQTKALDAMMEKLGFKKVGRDYIRQEQTAITALLQKASFKKTPEEELKTHLVRAAPSKIQVGSKEVRISVCDKKDFSKEAVLEHYLKGLPKDFLELLQEKTHLDSVSAVAAAAAETGHKMTWTNEVVSQQPNPIVKTSMFMDGILSKVWMAKNGKISKTELCAKIIESLGSSPTQDTSKQKDPQEHDEIKRTKVKSIAKEIAESITNKLSAKSHESKSISTTPTSENEEEGRQST